MAQCHRIELETNMRFSLAASAALLAIAVSVSASSASTQFVDQACKWVVRCNDVGQCKYYVVCEPITD
jgi:hypothetical protein